MFPILLSLHSLFRWLILISVVYSLVFAYRGWFKKKHFSKHDDWTRLITVSFAHIQLILGFWIYYLSPIVDYFLKNFSKGLHQTQARFFGLEHVTMMLIGVSLITIGSSLARRKKTDEEKFKAIAIWYSIALFIIFTSIPWQFSPFTSRPYLRGF